MTVLRGENGWERLFWLVFDRSSNPIALVDENRKIVKINDAAVKMLGGTPESLVGTSLGDRVIPAEQPLAAREWRTFLHSGEYAGTRDLVGVDGSEVRTEFAARMADVGGKRRAIYVFMAPQNGRAPAAASAAPLALTNREREIVTLIALGRDTGEIAAELHVSPETVRSHVRNSMAKLDVHTRAQLVAVVICAEQTLHKDCL